MGVRLMLENEKPAELTKIGKLTITASEIYAEGFNGNGETSCRDVAALTCVWAIGKLQRELGRILERPGKSNMGVD